MAGKGAPNPDFGLPFTVQGDLMVLAQTVLGEAEGESFDGKVAVAFCVMNRCKDPRWPETPTEVCLQPFQFSCFNDDSPRLPAMRNPAKHVSQRIWDECFKAACVAYFGLAGDPSCGANHYLNVELTRKLRGGTLPRWADERKITVRIGDHAFLAL